METAGNRHITEILFEDESTKYGHKVGGNFRFDGRTKKDQLARVFTFRDADHNITVEFEIAYHGWYGWHWRRMKRCAQKDAIQAELEVAVAEFLGRPLEMEYGVDAERDLAETEDGEGYSATEAELNELVAAAAIGNDKLGIPGPLKRS